MRSFTPFVFSQNGDVENIIEKSIINIDEQKEKKQRTDTIKIFIENVSRLETYITELKEDWQKVKIVNCYIKLYIK